ncbi:MAG: ArsC family reductase [Gammaproteobacteria bacterium]|nr:MAG: ArsC family reductase [Gammaproteobacteria bacterium]
MTTLYGISNCDTVKKARRYLDEKGVSYSFHDFRKDGLEPAQVQHWVDTLGWEALLNKRSTSWKALSPAARESMDDRSAVAAILQTPTLIKRPLLDTGSALYTGFKAETYDGLFA